MKQTTTGSFDRVQIMNWNTQKTLKYIHAEHHDRQQYAVTQQPNKMHNSSIHHNVAQKSGIG